jgi:hypothetical protein
MTHPKTLSKLRRTNHSRLQKEDKYLNDKVEGEGGYRDQCIKALDTLITFAGFLPNVILNEIFTYDKIKELNTQILHGNNESLHVPSNMRTKVNYSDSSHASRRLQIAHLLGEIQTKIYEDYWENENNVPPNEANFSAIHRLKSAQKECSDLGKTRVVTNVKLRSHTHAFDCKCQPCEEKRAGDKLVEISKSE